jgi:putative heme transporter
MCEPGPVSDPPDATAQQWTETAAPSDAPTRTRRRRRARNRGIKFVVKAVITWFVLTNLVFPQIAGARRALDVLGSVEPFWLVLGIALQMAALLSYSCLTRVTLPPEHAPPLHRLFRIQLATKAVTNVVPGGSAAGSALGYRLLTSANVPGPSAGFAMATTGLFSAVILNAIFLGALLVSIPFRGVNRAYLTAAVIGVLLMGGFVAVVIGVLKGRRRAERIVRWCGKRFRFIDEQRAVHLFNRLVDRLGELSRDPKLTWRAIGWASANWLLDAASLAVFLRAFGGWVAPDGLLVSFGLAQIAAVIPITPGGLGVIEGTLTSTLIGFGLDRGTASIGVVTYRLAAYWMLIPLGALAYLSLRVDRALAIEAIETEENRFDWADRYGRRASDMDGQVTTVRGDDDS